MSHNGNTTIIILAAGNSSRLGKAKQQLRLLNDTLLERTLQAALHSAAQAVVIVLGAYHEEILAESNLSCARVVVNPDWQLGMGSSIKLGLKESMEHEMPDRVILMLCDQPFVNRQLLTRLISTQKNTGKGIIACSYKNTMGVPVLFERSFFSVLMEIDDLEGAKKVVQQFPDECTTIPFPQGHIDIDTDEDYHQLIEKIK